MLGQHGADGLIAALESGEREKQLAALSNLPAGRPVQEPVRRCVGRLAESGDVELSCHAELTLLLEPVTPTVSSVRRLLKRFAEAGKIPQSVVIRVVEHHRKLLPCLRRLLQDDDPAIRRWSLQCISGVIFNGRFDYSWADWRSAAWAETWSAIRNVAKSQDTSLAAAARLILEDDQLPRTGGIAVP
jgi:hypothetical protein